MLVVHGSISIRNPPNIDSTALREWFKTAGDVEGIVWHCVNKTLFKVNLEICLLSVHFGMPTCFPNTFKDTAFVTPVCFPGKNPFQRQEFVSNYMFLNKFPEEQSLFYEFC